MSDPAPHFAGRKHRCHSERSEESRGYSRRRTQPEILRCAQDDNDFGAGGESGSLQGGETFLRLFRTRPQLADIPDS